MIEKFKEEHILDKDILCLYIKKCEEYSGNKTKYTEHHHILPKSLYPEYKSLIKNKWNGIHVTKDKHLLLHLILAKALNKNTNMNMAFKFINERCNIKYKDLNLDCEVLDIINNEEDYISVTKEIYVISDEHRKNIILNNKTRVFSKETRDKISKGNKNKKVSEEARRKIGEAQKGRTHSAETKLKMSKAQKGRKLSEEHIQKIKDRPYNKNRVDKMVKTKEENGRKFKLLKDGRLIMKITLKELRIISQGLLKSSKEKPLGFSSKSKSALNKCSKLFLIGLYTEEIIYT